MSTPGCPTHPHTGYVYWDALQDRYECTRCLKGAPADPPSTPEVGDAGLLDQPREQWARRDVDKLYRRH